MDWLPLEKQITPIYFGGLGKIRIILGCFFLSFFYPRFVGYKTNNFLANFAAFKNRIPANLVQLKLEWFEVQAEREPDPGWKVKLEKDLETLSPRALSKYLLHSKKIYIERRTDLSNPLSVPQPVHKKNNSPPFSQHTTNNHFVPICLRLLLTKSMKWQIMHSRAMLTQDNGYKCECKQTRSVKKATEQIQT